MIRFQIIEREGADLHRVLIDAMRSGDLQTFYVRKRGKKVAHINSSYPGWMNWDCSEGVIVCEVLSPHKPGSEWRLFHAFIGRLADRYSSSIQSINIQFAAPFTPEPKRPRKKRRKR